MSSWVFKLYISDIELKLLLRVGMVVFVAISLRANDDDEGGSLDYFFTAKALHTKRNTSLTPCDGNFNYMHFAPLLYSKSFIADFTTDPFIPLKG